MTTYCLVRVRFIYNTLSFVVIVTLDQRHPVLKPVPCRPTEQRRGITDPERRRPSDLHTPDLSGLPSECLNCNYKSTPTVDVGNVYRRGVPDPTECCTANPRYPVTLPKTTTLFNGVRITEPNPNRRVRRMSTGG